jgi:NarL family two-component system response regulator LiaR
MNQEHERKIRVMIVDDHAIVRQGLRTLLELIPDIEIAGEAANGRLAVESVPALKPDVVLMDLKMPEMDGITATQAICALGLNTRVIALTSFLEDESLVPAIQAGAISFLLKDVQPAELIEAIRAASRGEVRLNPNIARKLMEKVSSPAAPNAPGVPEISPRELEVLRLIASGKSNREIADTLVLSEKTVKSHVSSLLCKLNLNDRTQLAIFALKNHVMDEKS